VETLLIQRAIQKEVKKSKTKRMRCSTAIFTLQMNLIFDMYNPLIFRHVRGRLELEKQNQTSRNCLLADRFCNKH
jgi:hypothetical protein